MNDVNVYLHYVGKGSPGKKQNKTKKKPISSHVMHRSQWSGNGQYDWQAL